MTAHISEFHPQVNTIEDIFCIEHHLENNFLGGEDPEIYRNRKGYFSINGQFICNANLKILNVVARWPGSSHDSTIFNNCHIKDDFENGRFRQCVLLVMFIFTLKNKE